MPMNVIYAPEKANYDAPSVFLAGGISNCPRWHDIILTRLREQSLESDASWTILNPRRDAFPANESQAAREQIEWEFEALKNADLIQFWFPKETLCPITLFELGRWIASEKAVIVGTDPYYQRRFDVEVQCELARPGMTIHSSLDKLADAIIAELLAR
ncbi:MAG: nucleoside 2-deoxyribosyltransferase domain-containing protein [Planctomycetota bacterium]|nr:nucleoside 2-deoxyribosyltransferase domain-containing protein [Planctomycetota bacterium]